MSFLEFLWGMSDNMGVGLSHNLGCPTTWVVKGDGLYSNRGWRLFGYLTAGPGTSRALF